MGDLKPLVKCFISIGTERPSQKAIEDKMPKFLGDTLVRIATETEETARRFMARFSGLYDAKRYFRFNVEGLQHVGLEEYKERSKTEAATVWGRRLFYTLSDLPPEYSRMFYTDVTIFTYTKTKIQVITNQ
ncbi:putative patatin family protein [Rosellinia necatrix]|uniref:Putative patatin family protein n=1 Tax=Rosellinia necatrix TaxID=77044 RepID=A0A1S8A6C4_ROSNE|nr:putative patatin family protein [Rosellinia necatrix]